MSKLYYYEYEVKGWRNDNWYYSDGFIYSHEFGIALMTISGDDKQFRDFEHLKHYMAERATVRYFNLEELET